MLDGYTRIKAGEDITRFIGCGGFRKSPRNFMRMVSKVAGYAKPAPDGGLIFRFAVQPTSTKHTVRIRMNRKGPTGPWHIPSIHIEYPPPAHVGYLMGDVVYLPEGESQ